MMKRMVSGEQIWLKLIKNMILSVARIETHGFSNSLTMFFMIWIKIKLKVRKVKLLLSLQQKLR